MSVVSKLIRRLQQYDQSSKKQRVEYLKKDITHIRISKRTIYWGLLLRRFFALSIDVLILLVYIFLIIGLAAAFEQYQAPIAMLVFLVFPMYWLKDGFSGQSPGSRLLGVVIVDRDTLQPIGFARAALRHCGLGLGFIVSPILLYVSDGERSLGDVWGKTKMIRKNNFSQ